MSHETQCVYFQLRAPSFGANWQTLYLVVSEAISAAESGLSPNVEDLGLISGIIGLQRFNFDEIFSHILPKLPENPLRLEEEAWTLMSPKVAEFLTEFESYASPEQLLEKLKKGWVLIGRWNLISEAFKAKEQGLSDQVEPTEAALRQLIEQLRQETEKSTTSS